MTGGPDGLTTDRASSQGHTLSWSKLAMMEQVVLEHDSDARKKGLVLGVG